MFIIEAQVDSKPKFKATFGQISWSWTLPIRRAVILKGYWNSWKLPQKKTQQRLNIKYILSVPARWWGCPPADEAAHPLMRLPATSTTNWAQIFTGLLSYAYVEIHQVISFGSTKWKNVVVHTNLMKIIIWVILSEILYSTLAVDTIGNYSKQLLA